MMKLLNYSLCVLAAIVITACDFEVDNSLPGVPATGFFAAVGANQHAGEEEIQVAAAVFDDGDPINLVGGDVFEAATVDERVLLLKRGFYIGTYTANLPNATNLSDITMSIVHDNLAVTESRWYPTELFNIDPGPGELVGGSATITLPPVPVITAPQENTVFTSISDTFDLGWVGLMAGDEMKVRSAVTCDNGTKTETYGTVANLADNSDDGIETIGIDQFIFDITADIPPEFEFIIGEARALLQELLEKLSAGTVNQDFFDQVFPINPIKNNCEIRLFLFRERPGSFASASTDGTIFGSRSAEVTILYQPN